MNETQFWERLDRSGGPESCWEWQRWRVPCGYGNFHEMGKVYQAHRRAWELTNGPIPDGLRVLHRCDNPPCCNPVHLFLGTQRDNMRDMWAKGRARMQRPEERMLGEHNGQSKLTVAAVRDIKAALAAGESSGTIARRYGVTHGAIWNIQKGLTWAWVDEQSA